MLVGRLVEVCNLYNDDKYLALVLNVNKDCSLTVQKEDGSLDYLNSGEVRIVINK